MAPMLTESTENRRGEAAERLDGRSPVVLILGAVRIYRENLAEALGEVAGIAVLSAAASLEEAQADADGSTPDVILVDVSTEYAVQVIPALVQACPTARVVALGAPEDDEGIVACAAAGVAGFVAREGTLRDVVTTVRAVARGDPACPPRVTAALLRRVGASGREPPDRPNWTRLTSRERQILGLIDDGLSNKEIAARLYIEVSTVKNHVHNILAKLGARRRSEAAAKARIRSEAGRAALVNRI
jgi:two-component system, NarL family, nitrate/nitrite response regulator NarL